jgi:hypothetical protein
LIEGRIFAVVAGYVHHLGLRPVPGIEPHQVPRPV